MAEAEALQQQRAGEVSTPQQSPAAPASLGAAARSPNVLVVPRLQRPAAQQQRPSSASSEQRPALYRTRLCW